MTGPFDAAIDWLEAFVEGCAGPAECPQCAEHEAAIKVLEAAGKVDKEIANVAIGQIRRSILVKDLKLGGKMRDGLEAVMALLAALPEKGKPMTNRDLLSIRVRLEALISEREGMIAENMHRAHLQQSMAYCEDSFIINANAIRSLLPDKEK